MTEQRPRSFLLADTSLEQNQDYLAKLRQKADDYQQRLTAQEIEAAQGKSRGQMLSPVTVDRRHHLLETVLDPELTQPDVEQYSATPDAIYEVLYKIAIIDAVLSVVERKKRSTAGVQLILVSEIYALTQQQFSEREYSFNDSEFFFVLSQLMVTYLNYSEGPRELTASLKSA
jgi:hypothetical protein